MENEHPEINKPIDSEPSRTNAFGGGLGNYTEPAQEKIKAVNEADRILKENQKSPNIIRRFINRMTKKPL